MSLISFGRDRRSAGLSGTLVPIHLYNGGHGWKPGPVELRALKKGKAKYGPGLYTTTKLETAQKYAKGGGVISRFTVAPLTFDRDVKVTKPEIAQFLASIAGLHDRRRLEQRLLDPVLPDPRELSMEVVLNQTLWDERNGHGAVGLAVVRAAIAKGVDATVVQHSGEDWVVIYNVDKILKREVVKAGAPGVTWDLPTIFDLRRRGDAYPPVEPIPGIDDMEP